MQLQLDEENLKKLTEIECELVLYICGSANCIPWCLGCRQRHVFCYYPLASDRRRCEKAAKHLPSVHGTASGRTLRFSVRARVAKLVAFRNAHTPANGNDWASTTAVPELAGNRHEFARINVGGAGGPAGTQPGTRAIPIRSKRTHRRQATWRLLRSRA